MMKRVIVIVLTCVVVCNCAIVTSNEDDDDEDKIIEEIIEDCIQSKYRLSCFGDRFAKAVGNYMHQNLTFANTLDLIRSGNIFKNNTAKAMKKLTTGSHSITLSSNLSRPVQVYNKRRRPGDVSDNDQYYGHGLFLLKKAIWRREAKYFKYAFVVLLGIFGFTGPLVMKTLAVAAVYALLSAQVALIVVGGVALKQIFEKDDNKPKVNVFTIPLDDYHRKKKHRRTDTSYEDLQIYFDDIRIKPSDR